MPTWWLILSSLFFAIVAMLFVILCGMALQMIRLLKSIEPQVKGLVKQLGELSEQTKGLVKRVDGLTARIEGVADSAKGVADSARSTVDAVGGRARSLVGVAEGVALPAAKKLQAFAPYIAMGMTALKILGMLRDLKVSYQAVAPKKASAEKPSHKVS